MKTKPIKSFQIHNLLASRAIFAALLLSVFVPSARAANIWWDNDGAVVANVWGQTNNWATTAAGGTDPLAVPLSGDTAIFNVDGLSTAQTVAMNGARVCLGMQFTNGTGGWTLQAHSSANTSETLGIGSGGILVGSGVGPVALSNVASHGFLTIALNANQAWNLNSDLTCGAFLSGAYNLTKSGPNTLTLGSANAGFTGTINVNAGTLTLNSASSLTNATLDMNAADSGAVSFGTASSSLGALTGSRNLALPGGTTFIGNNGASTTYSGALTGGALTKIGSGTLTLSGANTYSGVTAVNGSGTLKIDAGAGGSLYGTSPYSALTLGGTGVGGGTFLYDNTTASVSESQNMGQLTSSAGANTVQLNRTAPQTTALTFGTYGSGTRSLGGTMNFVYGGTPGNIGSDSTINVNFTNSPGSGFMNGANFVDGSDYAYMNASNTYVRHPVYGTDTGFNAASSTLVASVHNLLNGNFTLAAAVSPTSIKVNTGTSISIGCGSFNLQCNNWLVTGGSTLSVNTGSGNVRGGGGSEIIVRADTASDKVVFGYVNDNSTSKLTKTGAGQLSYSGNVAGAITVNQGTLQVNGSAGAGLLTVMNGATLCGGGTIAGTVTVNSGGTIQPSLSGNTNNLKLSNAAAPTFNAGSILKIRVPTNSAADLLSLNNVTPPTFTATGVNLVIDTTGLSTNATGLTIVSAGAIAGTFASVTANNDYTATVHYNAASITVDLAGTITASGTLSAVNTTYGTASPSPASFTVSGSNLTGAPGDLTVTPPSGYEVSLSSGSGYTTSLSVPYSSATLANTTVYVRLAATTAVGTYSGNITIAGGGAASVTVATVPSTVSPADSQPVINQVAVSGGNLILQGTNGTALAIYSIITTTNLTTPLANWITNTTGAFDAGGAFSNGIPVGSEPAQFFQIKTP